MLMIQMQKMPVARDTEVWNRSMYLSCCMETDRVPNILSAQYPQCLRKFFMMPLG